MAPRTLEWENPTERYISSIGFGGMVFVGFITFLDPGSRIFGLAFMGVSAFLAVRAWRSGRLVLRADDLVIYELFRTRTLRLRSLVSVDVTEGMVGLTGYKRLYLTLVLVDGSRVTAKAFNCPVCGENPDQTEVARAARTITERLTELNG